MKLLNVLKLENVTPMRVDHDYQSECLNLPQMAQCTAFLKLPSVRENNFSKEKGTIPSFKVSKRLRFTREPSDKSMFCRQV